MADIFNYQSIDGDGTSQEIISNLMIEKICRVVGVSLFCGFLTGYAINCFNFFRHRIFPDGTNGIDEELDRERITNIMEDESIGWIVKCHKVAEIEATRMMNILYGGNEILVGIFISPVVGYFILSYFETEIDALVHYEIATLTKIRLIITSFFGI